jgi:uncharacterized protein YcfL
MARLAIVPVVALVLAGAAHAQRIVLVDRIAAVVNREVVTYSELRERTEATERDLQRCRRARISSARSWSG